ncbi:prepilin-type N-terminal cleavage/methylation domain-containing protein [Candidatus Gracilibacteria bacterium]|nr:prepilin-type N-terminal cleavage/methylation domain-containing protein [Candidatus Gracilibacteria bacterium]
MKNLNKKTPPNSLLFVSPPQGGGLRGSKKAFTLVELIIVITILAILATIAFVSFQNYSKEARDGNRVTTLKTIEKGISLLETKTGHYPSPEESVEISSGTIVYTIQGLVGDNISREIKLNKTSKDPKTKNNYIYSTNLDKTRYQLGTYLEDGNYVYNRLINKVYAEDTINTVDSFYTIGSKLGIFFTSTGNIVNKTNYLTGKLDLSSNENKNNNFIVYFSNDKETGKYTLSGNTLVEKVVEVQESDGVKVGENNNSNNGGGNSSNVSLDDDAYKYKNGSYAKNCKEYKENETQTLNSGNYWIQINGINSNNPFKVYCDMDKDGGGWTLVMRGVGGQNNTSYTTSNALNGFQIENATISTGTFLFSDNTLNIIRTNSGVYRVDVDYNITPINYSRYFSNSCIYNHNVYVENKGTNCTKNYGSLEDLQSNTNGTTGGVCGLHFTGLGGNDCSGSNNYLYTNVPGYNGAYLNLGWGYYKYNNSTATSCTGNISGCNMYIYVK